MEGYNPNAIWTSKKKKVDYTPPEPYHPPRTPEPKAPRPDTGAPGSGKKVLIFSIIAVVALAAAGGAWFFLSRPVPAPAVSMGFAVPPQVPVGDPFALSVLYTNSSTVPLRNASLAIGLPAGVFFAGQPATQQAETVQIGDVAPGYSGTESISLVAAATAASVVHVSSTLSYATDASKGKLFSTSAGTSLAVGSPVLNLAISAPTNVFAGQDFTSVISYQNASAHALSGVTISLQYPQGFSFVAATPTPAFPGNSSWNIGSLPQGGTGTITVAGSVSGKTSALYSLSGTAAENISGTTYTVAAQAANIAIMTSPLAVSAVLDNTSNYVAGLGDNLDYTITYANTSNVTFHNVAVTAVLSGAMFDLGSVQSKAAFNSKTNTLTWYPANTPALASVAPGTTGTLDLRITTKSAFPIVTSTDKNFTLGLHLGIASPTVPPGTTATSTSASADITNKVGGMLRVAATGYRYEPTVAIRNSGPYPPKVNQPTTYTIHWDLTNYATDASNVTVSAYLQSGTTCTGEIMSNISAEPVCDPSTGEVTWTIPGVAAGTGIIGKPLEAVFQVENTPAVNQVGQTITLLGKTTVSGTDVFTGNTLTASADPIGTDLPNDTAITTPNRDVVQ